jgi:glycosyl transferase family 87
MASSANQPQASAPIDVPRWAYPALTVASLLVGVTALVRGTRALVTIADSDLTNFFFKSADYILRGDPWHMYAVNVGGYPNYNPPLSIFLMAPLLALARALRFDVNPGSEITFVTLPFLLLIPLLGFLVIYTLRVLYPGIPETQRLLAFVLVVLGPLSWQTMATWYHIEQPLMLCLLIGAMLALQSRRAALAGVLAGLAVLTRTTAVVPLIALGVLLLLGRDWRALLKVGGIGALVAAIGFAPFFLFDRSDTLYSLVQWRGTAIIGGNSIWTIFARTPLDSIARRLDFYAVVLFVVIITFLAARRFNITAYSRDAWAVLALGALAVPLLSKTNWPYYYLEPFIFLLIWEFSSMHDRRAGLWRWPLLAISFLVVTATLSQYIYLPSVGAGDRILVGLLEFAAMGTFVVLVWVRLGAVKPIANPQPALNPLPSVPTTPWTPPAGSPALPRMPEPSRPPDWLPGVLGGPTAPDYRPDHGPTLPALPPLDNPLRGQPGPQPGSQGQPPDGWGQGR